ncbi:glycosyltransferase [Mediterranea massiliensis]|uniref:Glycosyltransferase n=1 Tax=Mediterranea massiliensis TaxID=1841865 RepID=A0ABS2E3L2_9BACT|nr:glycosyltransferase family 2 protein [Mediterranea massiliensis]MBM6736204.1 glycosyltransferase [Mediterranea massiliensis]
MVKISVITVCYNAASTLEATILSVLNQTYPNIEYIIIDGGSTDGSVDIIKKYADRLAYWVSEQDKGIYDAMNKGIKIASGDFLYFLGADDILIVDFMDAVNKISNKNSIYYGSIKLKNAELEYYCEFNKLCLVRNNVSHQAILYPRYVFSKFMYNLNYKLYADWLLNMQCLSLGISTHRIGYCMALYNDSGISGQNHDIRFLDDQEMLIKKYLGLFCFLYFKLIKTIRNIRNIF